MNAGAAEGANRRFATVAANRVGLHQIYKTLTSLNPNNIMTVNLITIKLTVIIGGIAEWKSFMTE